MAPDVVLALTFHIGDAQFAAPAADVTEVMRRPRITRVPNAPASLLGLTGVRGRPVPVVSLARLLGGEDNQSAASRLVLLAGDNPVAITVDRLGALGPLAAPAQGGAAGLGRIFNVGDDASHRADLDALIRQEFAAIAAAPRRADAVAAAEPVQEDAAPRIALLGFTLGGQAYGLPLEDVDEVMALPPSLSVIPEADDAALGAVEVRGAVLPVIDLRRLLSLPPGAPERIIVARMGEARVGLAVDRITAVLRVTAEEIDPAPAALNKSGGEAQVEAICRLRNDGGLVAILSSKRLFHDDKAARILAEGGGASEAGKAAEAAERFVIFSLGGEEYGLPLAAVSEVMRLPETLARAPTAPAFVEGVLNVRGKAIPVIDQRRRFAVEGAGANPRVLVATAQDRQAGFIVDAVSEILALPQSRIEASSPLTADAARLFTRVGTLDGGERLILLVEPGELLGGAERDLLAGMQDPAVGR